MASDFPNTPESSTASRKSSAHSSFVGRSVESAILRDAIGDVVGGRGRLMMLSGEPGIGKTRLAEETMIHARAHGAQIRWGRCWESGGAPAFWPWIQIIRESLAQHGAGGPKIAPSGSGLGSIALMVPELRSAFAIQDPLPQHHELDSDSSVRPSAERFRLFDAIAALFKSLTADAPMAIVLDDLHAADEDSLSLLHFIARELKQLKLLIIATFREIEARQSFQQGGLLSQIVREGRVVPLRGLAPVEVADFIRSNAPSADATIAGELHQATEGNPFFLDEIVRLMVAERSPGTAPARGARFTIPDSVRSVVYRRIAPFSEQTRSLLTTASVIGKEFDVELLKEVSGLSGEQIIDALEEALVNAVVIAHADNFGHYRFSHAIIAEALSTDLGVTARARLHQRIAAALERVHGDVPGPHLARLAHHHVQALPLGDVGKAVEFARGGAEHARNQLAFAETIRLYRMALQALPANAQNHDATRCEMLLAMGEALAQSQNLDEARRAFEQAADLARRAGHRHLLARSALHMGAWVSSFFKNDRALTDLFEEGLAAVNESDPAMRASLMAKLADARYWAGDREGGHALADQAVELARTLDDKRALVSALWNRNHIRWGPEDVEGRLASATEIATLAESIGEYQRALRAHELRFAALLEMGDIPAVENEIGAYASLARKAGERFGIEERFRAVLALLRGDFAEADVQIKELLQLAERRQDPALIGCAKALAGLVATERGRPDVGFFDHASAARLPESSALGTQYRIMIALGNIRIGLNAEASAELEALSKDNFAVLYRDWNFLDSLVHLSTLCVILREVRHAETLYRLILPFADRNVTAGWGDTARGSASLTLASLARLLGRLDDAERHFQQALAFNQKMGARPSIARTQFEYARMLLARAKSDDVEKGREMLRQAAATASALEMEWLTLRIRNILDKAAPAGLAERKVQPAPITQGNIFHREGEFWTVSYQGKIFRLKHAKGLQYISHLMRYPDREFHAMELVAEADGVVVSESPSRSSAEIDRAGASYGTGDAGAMLDDRAKAQYRQKLKELAEVLEEAKERDDVDAATAAEDEIDAIQRELARALGRGGRDRRASSDVERARLNVTRAIKTAIERIAENDTALGAMLTTQIRTGTFCSYLGGRSGAAGAPAIATGSIEAVAAAAAAEPRDLREQAAPDGTVTILFSDVEGSTVLVEKFGDLRAHEIVEAHNQIVREQLALHQGYEVKSMGDGFMVAFSSARRALLCAIAIQRALTAYRESSAAESSVRVRIGLHVGETIKQSDDFFGKTVILAARIAGLARGGEILVSSTFRDLTESAGDLSFESAGEVKLKGLSGKHRLFRAVW